MSLKEIVNRDFKIAKESNDERALRVLRTIIASIIIAETPDGRTIRELTPEDEVNLLQNLIKQKKESSDNCIKNGKEDYAKMLQEEIKIIEKYLSLVSFS